MRAREPIVRMCICARMCARLLLRRDAVRGGVAGRFEEQHIVGALQVRAGGRMLEGEQEDAHLRVHSAQRTASGDT